MLKGRAKYAAIVAAVSAPVYLLIQLLFGSDAGPSLVRTLWFFLLVFLVSLAVRWEQRSAPQTSNEEGSAAEGPPNDRP